MDSCSLTAGPPTTSTRPSPVLEYAARLRLLRLMYPRLRTTVSVYAPVGVDGQQMS